MSPDLRAALEGLARLPRLLVASDYDGVLAPIVTDPARAFALPEAMAAVRELAALPGTTVALVSGRARQDLAALAGAPPAVRLVGSHGSELAAGIRLAPAQAELRERLAQTLPPLLRDYPGTWLEAKPTSLVLHTRTASPEVGTAARAAVRNGPGGWPGVHLTDGKEIVELAVVTTHKGTAVATLRDESDADAVLFIGDDVTDENAFAVLRDQDVGVKVGPGDTLARYRVPDPPAVVQVLELLLAGRTSASS
jgi:trehalose-phosphatase